MASIVRKHNAKTESTAVYKHLGIAAGVGNALLAGFLLIAALVCLRMDISGSILSVPAYLCCALASFPAGFLAGKQIRKSGMLFGVISGVPICAALTVLALIFNHSAGKGLAVGCLLILLFAAAGGICGVNLRHRRRYR